MKIIFAYFLLFFVSSFSSLRIIIHLRVILVKCCIVCFFLFIITQLFVVRYAYSLYLLLPSRKYFLSSVSSFLFKFCDFHPPFYLDILSDFICLCLPTAASYYSPCSFLCCLSSFVCFSLVCFLFVCSASWFRFV